MLIPLLCGACTMTVRSTVRDQFGAPVPDAVVYATTAGPRPSPAGGTETLVVQGSAFRPRVLAVRTGTGVRLRNRDDLVHQVYSISPAKRFELRAGRLATSDEVVFGEPGVVVLGLALRDGAVGHVCVLDTPYFARTGSDGRAELELPRGSHEVRVWHPGLGAAPEGPARRVADSPRHRVDVDFTVALPGAGVRPGSD